MALFYYVLAILEDGDYLNDWLTHVPFFVRPGVEFIGHWLALLTGA